MNVFVAIFGTREAVRDNLFASATGLLYCMNWFRAFLVDSPHYLGHLWSLSVEEQFYILWPITLTAILAFFRGNRRRAGYALYAAALFVMVSRAIHVLEGGRWERVYNGTDFHSDGILLGCALALWRPPWLDRLARRDGMAATSLLGLLFLITGPISWGQSMCFGIGVVNILSAILVVHCVAWPVASGTAVMRILSSSIATRIGRISYGLYLWQTPVYLVLRETTGSRGVALVAGTLLIFLLASLSHRYFEAPIRSWGKALYA